MGQQQTYHHHRDGGGVQRPTAEPASSDCCRGGGDDQHASAAADEEARGPLLLKDKPVPQPWAPAALRRHGLQLLFGFALACTLAVFALPLLGGLRGGRGSTSFGRYFIAPSTIPGAGVGVFAREALAAGTVWNAEDARPESVIVLHQKQWTAIMGLANYLRDAGYPAHPIIHAVTFFDTYGYPCSNDAYVVSLRASTFANHAPEAPSSQRVNGAPAAAPLAPGSAATTTTTANSGGLPDGAPWVAALSPVEQCTLSVTLRDVAAGEELLEDYRRYCDEGEKCGDLGLDADSDAYIDDDADDDHAFGAGGAAASAGRRRLLQDFGAAASSSSSSAAAPSFLFDDDDDDDEEDGVRSNTAALSARHIIVQLPGVQLANSSVPGGAAPGLGLFAARPIPAGSVWNKADAEHALRISRGQWDSLLKMQASLAALGVVKPIVNNFVDALRTLGYCCPGHDSLWVPLTDSLFTNRGHRQASHKPPGSSSWRISSRTQQQQQQQAGGATRPVVNSQLRAALAAAAGGRSHTGAAAPPHGSPTQHMSEAQACTWSQALKGIARGEEILDDRRAHGCGWPGFRRA